MTKEVKEKQLKKLFQFSTARALAKKNTEQSNKEQLPNVA